MIRVIKLGDVIYQGIESKVWRAEDPDNPNSSAKLVYNPLLPSDAESLKNTLMDTLGWIVGQEIVKTVGDSNKKDASNSKAIVLLAKLISTLNPDTSGLTENELNAYNKMLALAENGYSDSTLLNRTLDAVISKLHWYAEKLNELNSIDTNSADALDKLIAFAENL